MDEPRSAAASRGDARLTLYRTKARAASDALDATRGCIATVQMRWLDLDLGDVERLLGGLEIRLKELEELIDLVAEGA